MFAKGVTCSDCHDPHSLKLRAPGNARLRAVPSAGEVRRARHHHHHQAGIDGRGVRRVPHADRDLHGGRPAARSQHSASRGPICTRHARHAQRVQRSATRKEAPQWAADAVAKWYGRTPGGYQRFAEAFAAAMRHAPDARSQLMKIAGDAAQPAIVRASALERLASDPTPVVIDARVERAERSRRAGAPGAVDVLSGADPAARLRFLPRMLDDPVRAVRIDAARSLAALPSERIPADRRASLDRALDEYVAAQRFNADRPEGALESRRAARRARRARQGRGRVPARARARAGSGAAGGQPRRSLSHARRRGRGRRRSCAAR